MFYSVRNLAAALLLSLVVTSCNSNQDKKAESATKEPDISLPDSLIFADVAPIIYSNCSGCHQPGSAGPFSLLSFEDVAKRTKTIKYAIQEEIMPPWPADTTYRRYKDEHILTFREKKMLLKWLEDGAPRGDKPIPPPPEDFGGTRRGTPDKVIPVSDTIFIAGSKTDQFRLIKVPFELPRDTIVSVIEFVPGNRKLVHHVNAALINYAPGKKKDIFAGRRIFDSETTNSLDAYREMQLANDDGSYPPLLPTAFNYLPGVQYTQYPDNIGNVFVSSQAVFLLQNMHFGPSPVDTFDLSHINLYYGAKRSKRPLRELHMGTLGQTPVQPEFVIYADSITTFTTRYKVPEDISVLTINPHMHLLGKKFLAFAVSPDRQDTIPLVRIPQWNFRWQYFYTFRHMLKIPKGYEIIAMATFDNTTDNPENPFFPPRTIRTPQGDMKTTDEMFQFFVTYLPYKPGDEKIAL